MALIWGIPYLFIKIAVTELSPASLVLFRTAIGTVLLLPLAAARKDLVPVLKQWRWILVYSAVEVAAPWFLLSDAEQRISSSLAGLLLAATPSFGAILAVRGVGFWSGNHPLRGAAPNGAELHPVIGLRVVAGC